MGVKHARSLIFYSNFALSFFIKTPTLKIDSIKRFFKKHPVIGTLLSIALTAFVLLWIIMIFLDIWTHHGDDSIVPDIKHLTYAEAHTRLAEADLNIEISDSVYDTSYPPGTIIESWPKAGSHVKRGRKVYVTLTAFSAKHVTISMPVTGVSVRQAMSYLNALGINTVRIVNVPSQYPNLVERALVGDRPIGVGSVLPVDASVTLEVGQYVEPDTDDDIDNTLDFETNDIGESEPREHQPDYSVAPHSTYIDDEP